MAKILPSILTGDFMNLPSEVDMFKEEGIDEVHIDVMDGNFFPNFFPKFSIDLSDAIFRNSFNASPFPYKAF